VSRPLLSAMKNAKQMDVFFRHGIDDQIRQRGKD